jgi:DNA-binding XRE family transcriptional regulator
MADKEYIGDPKALRAWQKRMGFTFDSAAVALGISRSTYASMLALEGYKTTIDLRTSLACAALEAELKPLPKLRLSKASA